MGLKGKRLELTDVVRAATISELTEKLEQLDGTVRLAFETRLDLCEGLCIRYGGYRKEIQEFCDAFGFMPDHDVTVYKHAVYLYDEKGDEKFLGIFPGDDCKGGESEAVVHTVAGLLEQLKLFCGNEGDDIQILSPDANFELKGSITRGVCLACKVDRGSCENWLVFED